MQYNLLEDRILVDPTPSESKTSTGIILVETQTDASPTTGLVIAVGPGRTASDTGIFIPNPIRPGQNIMWSKFAGTSIVISGVRLLLMRASDISMTVDHTENKEFDTLLEQIQARNFKIEEDKRITNQLGTPTQEINNESVDDKMNRIQDEISKRAGD